MYIRWEIKDFDFYFCPPLEQCAMAYLWILGPNPDTRPCNLPKLCTCVPYKSCKWSQDLFESLSKKQGEDRKERIKFLRSRKCESNTDKNSVYCCSDKAPDDQLSTVLNSKVDSCPPPPASFPRGQDPLPRPSKINYGSRVRIQLPYSFILSIYFNIILNAIIG